MKTNGIEFLIEGKGVCIDKVVELDIDNKDDADVLENFIMEAIHAYEDYKIGSD